MILLAIISFTTILVTETFVIPQSTGQKLLRTQFYHYKLEFPRNKKNKYVNLIMPASQDLAVH